MIKRAALVFCLLLSCQAHGADTTQSTPSPSSPSESVGAADKACVITKLRDRESSIFVINPGEYCLVKDVKQTDIFRKYADHFSLVKKPGHAMIEISSPDVTIDLMGHHLTSDMELLAAIDLNWPSTPPSKNLRIRNGKISKPGRALVLMPAGSSESLYRFLEFNRIGEFHSDMSRYPTTDYVLENLTLDGNNEIIVMQGRRNIIRNCKIIGGNSTVNLMGPNLIFENNEIIFNAKPPALEQDGPPIALYLQDAGDSIIRNNRITVLSHDVPGTSAIVLKNSPNVTIEGNTVSGVVPLYKALDAQFSAVVHDNVVNESVSLTERLKYSRIH
jgi:hypothetical protein